MLSARISIELPNDWTSAIGDLDIQGDIYTATLHKRHYMGLIRIYGEQIDAALDLLQTAEYHTSIEVIQQIEHQKTSQASVLVRAELEQETPYTILLENGYMPLDPTVLRNGREYFDLIIRNRKRLFELIDRLDDIGSVSIERVVSQVELPAQPNPVAWNNLRSNLTDRQFEVLTLAVEQEYFAIPRQATLDDLASELDLQKSTVGEHLRRSLGQLAQFTVENSRT
ncbi:helix-turn-helix domain-containing protein [Haladaptatus pallidirubidus]|uniref:HTH bat-type domain-containing protein n=1 Tax=Haladaptatus pallidirubidus TaxID=1008152 RepID=A0AAV3URL8_9EURY|nr:helix-turn-helix domain-containing protein [Haladaptatus pallidirubidus]